METMEGKEELRFRSAEEVRRAVDKYQEENPWKPVTYWGGQGENPPWFAITVIILTLLVIVAF